MSRKDPTSRTRQARAGDTIDRIARRLYDVREANGDFVEERIRQVRGALVEANPELARGIEPGQSVVLVDVPRAGPFPKVHIATVEAFHEHVAELCDRINSDPALGASFLVDPVEALRDIDWSLSEALQRHLRRTTLGYSRSQSDAAARVAVEGRLAGFESVTLRPHGSAARRRTSDTRSPEHRLPNPIGDFDTVFELSERVVDGIVKLTYDEGVFPHRVTPGGANPGLELVVGRPESLTFEPGASGRLRLVLPLAVVQGSGAKRGVLTIVAGVQCVESNGKPTHVTIDAASATTVSIQSTELTSQEISLYTGLAKLYLMPHIAKIPLSPILAPLDKNGGYLNFGVDDLSFKVHPTTSPSNAGALAVCLNFAPNNGLGSVDTVSRFAASDWGAGVNERILKQKFSAWWSSPDADKFRRLNRDKLEHFKTLTKEEREQIFDPNGDVHVCSIDFALKNGAIGFSVEVTVEDAFLWIDVDVTLTGDVSLAVNAQHELTASVSNVDSSVSCWSKFLIALFCAFVGFLAGFVIGGILGGVIGGVVGITVGATIGATMGAIAGSVIGIMLPALADAMLQNKLNALSNIELIDLAYDWQVPGSTRTVSAAAEWITILPGEVLAGGQAKLPARASTAVDITEKTISSLKVPIALPWDSEAQLEKLGSPPHYLVFSKIECRLQSGAGLEKPLVCTWKVAGEALPGQGDAVEVVVTPSVTNVWVGTAGSMPPKGDTTKLLGKKLVAAVQVIKTVRVIQSDGAKGAPVVLKEVVQGPLDALGTVAVLEIEVTDAFLTRESCEHVLTVPVLGDALADWWANNKQKYQAALSPDELIGPKGMYFPGGGLLPPEEVVAVWRSEFSRQPHAQRPVGFDQAILALNIEGAHLVEERDLIGRG